MTARIMTGAALAGLANPVTVQRDANGTVTIDAASEADALRQQVAALEQRLAALEAKGQNVASAGQEA